ncbi:PAS domain S-box-containing protein [Salinimicrobium catena]|uniref:histidine kinase n=1 Tax=Salinimicrobium catena TaxID=390640 RepID=A0A1H5KZX5_9FLAO|nr:PAS domain S-box protein [Salinimicrobium catena]SDL04052.1 PAS domain S-box-containing protein [Salinimicrobium catena]SEE70429.1 PAS domain S-box-containing protein [Salinimicrobium catena]
MERNTEEVKFLYFTSGIIDELALFNQVFGDKAKMLETQIVTNIEDFDDELRKDPADVILIDHTASFNHSELALIIMQRNGLDIPLILLIDEGSEEEAIGFLSKGVDDYIFLDRPYRLPISVRKIRKKYFFKAEKEVVLQQLREKSSKLQTAQRIAKLGYWEKDMESHDLFWTDEVYRIWGRNKDSYTPTFESFVQSIHPGDKERFLSENDAAVAGLRSMDFEYRIILPDGRIKWVHERGALSFTESGRRVFEGTVQDITEEKLNSQKLVTNESRILGILKSQTNYLIRVDLEGNYSYCNEKFTQDFKWIFSDQNLIGKPALSSVKESSHSQLKDIFYKCLSQPNNVVQAQIEKLQEEGGEKFTIWDFVCLTDAEGTPVEIQGVGIDIMDRVEVEQNLVESNKRYELVTKATSDAIYDWDCLTGEILWSSNYSRLFGYSEDLAPTNIDSWFAKVHPEDAHVYSELTKILEGTTNFWQVEYRYRRSNGNYAHVLEKGTIVRNEAGQAVRMVGAIQDITDRKEAMQKLMRSESRHKGIIQSQTNYVIRIDLEGKYSYCNEKFFQDYAWIYGGNLIGENSLDSVMNYHHDRLAEVSKKCLANPGQVFQVEVDKPGINNTVKTTLWDMIFLAYSSSQKEELQCVGIDITDRVKAEKDNLFQANLLDKIGQAVIATDNEGLITYWNKAATEMYGWSRKEVLGRNILRFTLSSKSREKGKEILDAMKQGRSWSGELFVRRKDGSAFPALITDSPFFDESGKFGGFIGVSSDITERKKANDKMLELNQNLRNYTNELVTANKGLEQFSYIVSHNLRAPVANILGLGELISSGDYSEDLKQQLLQEVISNVKRLDSVITDLNDILQVKVGMSEKKEKVSLEGLVESITLGISRALDQDKIEIRTNFSEVPEFNAPKSYLHSIFSNLISNSIKYRRPGVELVLEVNSRKGNDKTIFEFCDNGMGIDLEKKGNQIFGLYKRFHNHVEGKGMGLFMVKTQVELLGGVINVYSRVNEGTRFVLEFKNEGTQIIEDEKRTAVFPG